MHAHYKSMENSGVYMPVFLIKIHELYFEKSTKMLKNNVSHIIKVGHPGSAPWSGSAPNLIWFFPVWYRILSPSYMEICPVGFVISLSNKQTQMKT